MAAGILRALMSQRSGIVISSAGTHALIGNPATDFAVIAAAEGGIDISGHRARMIGEEIIRDSGIILCMDPFHIEYILEVDISAEAKTFNLAEFSDGGKRLKKIADPYGCGLREYRECFADIGACVRNFVDSEYFSRLKRQ